MAAATSSVSKAYNTHLPWSITVKSAHAIPKACMELAAILEQEPLFDGWGAIFTTCKVIALTDWFDVRICDIFSANSKKNLGESASWHIHGFVRGNNRNELFNSRGEPIWQGISLWLYDQFKRCSYKELEDSYNQVFSEMTTGWKKAESQDHLVVLFKEDPKEFELFTKKASLVREDNLICCMASKFFLEDNVKCHAEWRTDSGYCHNGRIYLWIRKTELESVVEKMGFKL